VCTGSVHAGVELVVRAAFRLNITREMDDACIGHHGVAILSCIQGFRHCDIESYAPLLHQLLRDINIDLGTVLRAVALAVTLQGMQLET
jgi:hypothetical protein